MERFTDTEGREIGLRGKRGLSLLEVDSQNRIVREISNQESVSGNSLVLTIDADIQRVMEDSLAETVEKLKQERPKSGWRVGCFAGCKNRFRAGDGFLSRL